MKLKYIVKENDNYKTINDVLKKEFNISSRLFTKLLKTEAVFLNNKQIDTRTPINPLNEILINLDYEEENENVVPTKMNLAIIYEDEFLIAVDKPSNMPVHPSAYNYSNTLSNGIRFYFDKIGLKKKIRPINRLDKDTSGVVLFAKCEYIQEALIVQMKNNTLKKKYIALVDGFLKEKSGIIDKPIARKENTIIERCISPLGKDAITRYKVLDEYENNNLKFSLLECELLTGRTHQIRLHLKSIGHPILGDTLYGKKSNLIARQALHSLKLEFIHPISKEKITLLANVPDDFKNLIDYKF